eukprot:1030023-Prorocentrum_minimum.AAC.1
MAAALAGPAPGEPRAPSLAALAGRVLLAGCYGRCGCCRRQRGSGGRTARPLSRLPWVHSSVF